MKRKYHPFIAGVLLASATLATQSLPAAADNTAGANWQIGLRPIWRANMEVSVEDSSYVQSLGLHPA